MDCLKNLHKCKASCCRGVAFTNVKQLTNIIILDRLSSDSKRFYELHGFFVKQLPDHRWSIKIPIIMTDNISYKGNTLDINVVCSGLDKKNKCKFHDTDKKPKICTMLNEKNTTNYIITKGCILNQND